MSSELMSDRENVRRAIEWIGSRRKDDPSLKVGALVEEASRRYDLGPADEEFLWRALAEKTS